MLKQLWLRVLLNKNWPTYCGMTNQKFIEKAASLGATPETVLKVRPELGPTYLSDKEKLVWIQNRLTADQWKKSLYKYVR